MNNKILANMTQHLTLLKFLSTFSLWLIPALLGAREPQIEVQQILQTTQSWDGTNYQSYPTGQPQLTVLRIKVPPNTALHWHHHPVISVGYVLSGELTLEKKATGERTIVHPGQALAELSRRRIEVSRRTNQSSWLFSTPDRLGCRLPSMKSDGVHHCLPQAVNKFRVTMLF